MLGGRVSADTHEQQAWNSLRAVLPPADADGTWQIHELDSDALQRMSPSKLMELLANLSPDVSRALWDFLRMCNPGWTAKALKPRSKTQDRRAQAVLDAFLAQLTNHYGAVDVQINRLFIAAFLRGAFAGELVLDAAGRTAVDLATPDPAALRFRKRTDELRGTVWQLCQWQNTELVDLDRPTIRYIPIDPLPGSPYGRALAAPALFAAIFLLAMLHDLRRVVQQQGYPRIDIEVDFEQLKQSMPEEAQEDPDAFTTWINEALAQVMAVYRDLKPDQAYVHSSAIKINRPVGTVDSSSLGAVDGLIKGLERMLVRALKTMPLMMGTTDGVSEANASRQWEIHVAGIKSLQHLCEQLLEHLLSLALQAQGIAARVEFRFAELRSSEILRDAQAEALIIKNTREKYAAGWIGQDQAAQEGAGVDKADVPEPRAAIGTVGDIATVNPEPGAKQ